jgi:hypothetical protein
MGSHLFTSRSGSNLGIRMRKKPTYLYRNVYTTAKQEAKATLVYLLSAVYIAVLEHKFILYKLAAVLPVLKDQCQKIFNPIDSSSRDLHVHFFSIFV